MWIETRRPTDPTVGISVATAPLIAIVLSLKAGIRAGEVFLDQDQPTCAIQLIEK